MEVDGPHTLPPIGFKISVYNPGLYGSVDGTNVYDMLYGVVVHAYDDGFNVFSVIRKGLILVVVSPVIGVPELRFKNTTLT